MVKATVEPVWSTQAGDEMVSGYLASWSNTMSRWGKNSMDVMRHLVSATNGFVITKDNSFFLTAFIRRRHDKVCALEQSMKDEFFNYSCLTSQNKVPSRVWKRHSALLVYGKQVNRQQQIYKQ